MAQFSATDAALEGFRLTREQPRTVLVWAALLLVANLIGTGLIVSLAGEAFTSIMGGGEAGPDPDEALANIQALGPLYALLLPLAILLSAVLTAAIYRAVLRPSEGGPGHLGFGADELRLAGATFLLVLLLGGAMFAVILVASLVIGLLASGGGAGAAVGGGFLAVFLALGVMIFIGVRFSLALPATFAERRIRIRESWRLTKGRFWPLLGCYLLAVILALVIYLLAMMIYLAIAAVVGGGIEGATSVFRPNYSSFGELYSAAMIVYVLVTAVVSAVTTAITTAPAAAAYRDIAGYGQDAAEVFS